MEIPEFKSRISKKKIGHIWKNSKCQFSSKESNNSK